MDEHFHHYKWRDRLYLQGAECYHRLTDERLNGTLMMTLLHLGMILYGLNYKSFLFVGIRGGGSEFRANWTTLAAGVRTPMHWHPDTNLCRHPALLPPGIRVQG
eukprot:TRINITY_DN22269_c0_g1_i1.p1 TRINITY_DN22269_c0_g1~~TRINITY_DN22269_c0_g1_i1.p1  ORF type:complete len:104 (+),score=5.27 TRINITY_DN22269_c0_g1_i1:275-586(+)